MTDLENREAFETWYIANHHDGDIHPNQQLLEWSEKGGFYFASSVEDLWDSWQASSQRQGFKLIPLEPTKEMYLVGTHELTQIDFRDIYDSDSIQIYKAMINAV